VLVFDPKESESCAKKAVHLHNTSDMVLVNGVISVLEAGRFMAQVPFAPMLPQDDQLINYDQDTSVSILRSWPAELQSTRVETATPVQTDGRIRGCTLSRRSVKTTRYVIKNNSVARTVPRFYIDHTASAAHGGYTITTTERCIKAVTGFSRFEISLAPGEEILIDVSEEAVHDRHYTSCDAIRDLTESADCADLVQAGILSEELLGALKALIDEQRLRQVYSQLETFNFTESDVRLWQQGRIQLPDPLLQLVIRLQQGEAASAELARQARLQSEHVNKIFTNQERLRCNIQSLEKVASNQLVNRYLDDLDREEDDLIATNKQIYELEEQQAASASDIKELKLSIATEAAKLRAALGK
jgi:hypothetical protein